MTVAIAPHRLRRRRALVIGVVVAVVVAVAGVAWVWHNAVARVAGADCPDSQRAVYQDPVVPAGPTVGSFGTGARPRPRADDRAAVRVPRW